MKFRNPKTGEVCEDIEDAFEHARICLGRFCRDCQLSKLNNKRGLPCEQYMPQRAHPRPPYYECLYRSSRFDKAGEFDQATKDKIKSAKAPVVDLETLKVYADKSELHSDTRWRYLMPEEIEIFKR